MRTHNSIGAPFPVPGRIGNHRGNGKWGLRGLAPSVVKLAESNLAVQASPIESNLAWEPRLLGSDHSSLYRYQWCRDTYETNLSSLLVLYCP